MIYSFRVDFNSAEYGFYSYRYQETPLTEEEFIKNIDWFVREFDKRLDSVAIRYKVEGDYEIQLYLHYHTKQLKGDVVK